MTAACISVRADTHARLVDLAKSRGLAVQAFVERLINDALAADAGEPPVWGRDSSDGDFHLMIGYRVGEQTVRCGVSVAVRDIHHTGQPGAMPAIGAPCADCKAVLA